MKMNDPDTYTLLQDEMRAALREADDLFSSAWHGNRTRPGRASARLMSDRLATVIDRLERMRAMARDWAA